MLSEQTGTPVHLKSARLIGFHTLILKDLYIEDYKQDTLIASKRLIVKLDSFNLDSSRFYINKIELRKMFFNLQEDTNKMLNIEPFIDSLSKGSSDSNSKPIDLRFKNISIKDSKFAYEVENFPKVDYEINWDDIFVTDLNVDIENLYFKGDTAFFKAKSLSLKEKTGFFLKHLSGEARLCSNNMNLKNISIVTPYSNVNVRELDYKWEVGKDYWPNFVTKMQQLYVVDDSYASFEDIAYFNGKLAGLKEVVRGKGTAFNTISDFKVKDVEIYFGKNSKIIGEFSSLGLPDIFSAHYKTNFKNLVIDINDIENIYIPWEDDKKYTFWDNFKKLGNISYIGEFDGSFEDFMCTGKINTKFGDLVINSALEPIDNSSDLKFKGFVQFLDFDLGKFIDNSALGNIKLNVELNGVFDKKVGFDGIIDGNISKISYNNYEYNNIDLFGVINKKKFSGELNIQDENISMNFMGGIDYNDKFPIANFKSSIKNANVKALNILDTDLNLSFDVKADFTGNSLESFDGSINILNTICKSKSDSINISNFYLYTGVDGGRRQVSLKSDFASMDIIGEYKISSLMHDFQSLFYKYIPNYKPSNYVMGSSLNKFYLNLTILKTHNIFKFFYPSLRISENTSLYWNHRLQNSNIFVEFKSPMIVYNKCNFKDVNIKLFSDDESLKCKSSIGTLSYTKLYQIHNLKNNIEANNNIISSDLSWNNWSESTYSGFFSGKAVVSKLNNKKVKTDISLGNGILIVSDSTWDFYPATISIIDKDISINNFRILKDSHFIGIDGKISRNPKESLNIILSKCDLDKLYRLVGDNSNGVSGSIDGYISISDFYNNSKAVSDVSVKNFVLKNDTIGDFRFKSEWDNKSQRLLLDSYNEIDNKKQISARGWYQPSSDDIALHIFIDKFKLSHFNTYTNDYVSDLSGYVNADFVITNKISNPFFTGSVSMDNSSFVLNSTNSKYFCSDTILFSSSDVLFRDFIINDENKQDAVLNGSIRIIKKPLFDLSLDINNFSLLNTKESDNENFYGNTVLTGKAQLIGSLDDLNVEVNVKTEKGTNINIPITSSSSVSSSDFITFIKIDEDKKKSKYIDPMHVDIVDEELSKFDYSKLNLNCNIEITEDANTQIIFDEKLGDAIKAKGEGNLKVELNSDGEIGLYGAYNITQGSYLFTLRNVINKRFSLDKGGSIKWNGSPYKASIDLNAIYKVRASLYDLMPDNKDPNFNISQKIPINCVMNLTENLSNPNIKFNIDFPSLNQQNKSHVESLFRGQEDINKQVLFLLIFNRFYTPEYVTIDDNISRSNVTNAGVTTTVSELLTNQLSNWISQISDDFDFGFKYRPKDEISSDELELALSTQFFSNRVTLNINGNIDTGNNQNAVTRNNTITGDFDLDIKLTQKGDLRMKAFNRTNDQVTYKSSKATQGIGIQYQDEFNSFSELISRYFNAIFKRKEEDK